MLRILIVLTVMAGVCSLASAGGETSPTGGSCSEQSRGDANYVSSVLDGLKQ